MDTQVLITCELTANLVASSINADYVLENEYKLYIYSGNWVPLTIELNNNILMAKMFCYETIM